MKKIHRSDKDRFGYPYSESYEMSPVETLAWVVAFAAIIYVISKLVGGK